MTLRVQDWQRVEEVMLGLRKRKTMLVDWKVVMLGTTIGDASTTAVVLLSDWRRVKGEDSVVQRVV